MARGFFGRTSSYSTPINADGTRTCPTCGKDYIGLAYGVVRNDGYYCEWQCRECRNKQYDRIRAEGYAIDFNTKITKKEYFDIRGFEYK